MQWYNGKRTNEGAGKYDVQFTYSDEFTVEEFKWTKAVYIIQGNNASTDVTTKFKTHKNTQLKGVW